MRVFTRNILLVISISALFVACSDKKDANKSNFKTAINSYIDKKCIDIGSMYSFPLEIENNAFKKDELSRLGSLEKVGLLKSTSKQIKDKYSRVSKLVDGFEYELTDLGKQAFVEEDNRYGGGKYLKLCAGKYKVTEVTNFTEPSDMFGVKISQVNFKKEAIDVPAWAYDLVKEKEFEYATKRISKDIDDDIVLILTNDGWVTEKEFKK